MVAREDDMKNVLILEGSPRMHGNSAILSKEFARGAREAGYEVREIKVARKEVAGCLGCDACYRNGGICVQKDEMAEIREAMLSADVIVLASPIYFYSMSAQLKLVVDRTYPFFRRLAGKTFCYLVTCAADDESYAKTMIATLDGFTCCVPDAEVAGMVIGVDAGDAGDVRSTPAMEKAYQLGASLR